MGGNHTTQKDYCNNVDMNILCGPHLLNQFIYKACVVLAYLRTVTPIGDLGNNQV